MRYASVLGILIATVSGSLAWAQAPSASEFVMKASMGNAFEIEQASLALKQSSNQKVKEFAHMMTTDHTKAEQKLEAAAKTQGMMATSKLDGPHQGKVEALRGTTGTAFDKAYIADQLQAHMDTEALLEAYRSGGDNEALKAWATETLPAVKEHLNHVKMLSSM